MTPEETVTQARQWADDLVLAHMRGPGDTIPRASERAAKAFGLRKRLFLTLRYRHPKDIAATDYLKLREAWTAYKALNRW